MCGIHPRSSRRRFVCLVFLYEKKYNKANGQSCANRKRKKVDFMANILVVEDEKSMQEIIVEYMQRGGHTCFTADDGMDALLALKNHPMDLMILDIMMPHLDGFSVCKMAREMSSLPIMILTAKSDEEDKLKGYEYGADDYMTK